MRSVITRFEIPGGAPIPSDRRGLGPSAELVAFHPEPVRAVDVVGRVVEEIIPYAGTSGMGGPGFFGLKLGHEWLIIAVRSAGEWMECDGRRVEDGFYDLNGAPAPWITDTEDRLSPVIVGRSIAAIEVAKTSMAITFDNGLALSIEESSAARPIFQGSGEPRVFDPDDDLREAVFLSPTTEIWA